MARPRATELPVHTKKRLRKLKDGTTSVVLIEYQYDYEKKNYRTLNSQTIGYLPAGSTDMNDMIPVENPKPGPKPGTKRKKKLDRHDQEAGYSSCLAVFALMLCAGSGSVNTAQIQENWKQQHPLLWQMFANCPERNISEDTIRDFYFLLGKMNWIGVQNTFKALILEDGFLRLYREILSSETVDEYVSDRCDFDGQKVLVSKGYSASGYTWHTLSFCYFDEGKAGEAQTPEGNIIFKNPPYGPMFEEFFDIRGSIVTAYAPVDHAKAARNVLKEGADYCLKLTDNDKKEIESLRSLFKSAKDKEIAGGESKEAGENGKTEQRIISVLPASLLDSEILAQWPGLEDGCVAEFKSATDFVEDEEKRGYYFTSLQFKRKCIAEQLFHIIINHPEIESNLEWNFDITYCKDISRCNNADIQKGKMLFESIMKCSVSFMRETMKQRNGLDMSYEDVKESLACFPALMAYFLAVSQQLNHNGPSPF